MTTKQKKKLYIFSPYLNKPLLFSALLLYIFGSFMIISAEMGNHAGSTAIIISTATKQLLFFVIGFIGLMFMARIDVLKFRSHYFELIYWILFGVLIWTRFFRASNGAYGWIYLFGFSIQPSELAKVFIILYGAKTLGRDMGKRNLDNFKKYAFKALGYIGIIVVVQHDLGSGVVLAVIAYCIAMVPPYKELSKYHSYMKLIVIGAVLVAVIGLSPIGTSLLKKVSHNYMVGRFLSSANPFENIYDDGYHLVMALVSIATGGWFGLGYGNSIHKYMNFPNPSNDFILPVIIEEMGIILGLLPVIVFYTIMFFQLFKYALRIRITAHKMVLLGTFLYLIVHFILNVGGVAGFIPLTGVPLLLVSSGGTSAIAIFAAIGASEFAISNYLKEVEEQQ